MKKKSLIALSCFAAGLVIFTLQKDRVFGDPKTVLTQVLAQADIRIQGDRPWDMQVHNEDLYARVVSGGSLALGEAYTDGWWDCKKLDEFFFHLLRSDYEKHHSWDWSTVSAYLNSIIFNLQSPSRAYEVGEAHYDLGNDLFANMLDSRMVYSCGYWKNATNLEQAQLDKLELICQKLQLKPGMKVLDIGCGWGSLALYAAQKYSVSVVGITISKEQAEYAQARIKGLPVEIRLQDYRELDEQFDRVVSVGMFEHVGYKNYLTFMQVVHRCLKDDGIFLLHTIGGNRSTTAPDPWINKYIFPNGLLPGMKQIATAVEGLFIMEDWHNFGVSYDKTLMAWHENFVRNWDTIKTNYDERFYRLWNYYLLSCAGLFRARGAQLWQIVFSKKGLLGGYESVR